MSDQYTSITELLQEWRHGDSAAEEALLAQVYDQLRSIARSRLRGRRDWTLMETTALVHDAYTRLVEDGTLPTLASRDEFFRFASWVMKRVLIDHVRAEKAQKRGGGVIKVPLELVQAGAWPRTIDLVALDQAHERLARAKPRSAEVFQLRFFGGLEVNETSRILGISPATVKRDFQFARAWLTRSIGAAP